MSMIRRSVEFRARPAPGAGGTDAKTDEQHRARANARQEDIARQENGRPAPVMVLAPAIGLLLWVGLIALLL